jgi:hypothetical protein
MFSSFNSLVSEAFELCRSDEYQNIDVCDLFTKNHRMLMRQIRCLQPGFIVYETVDFDEDENDEYWRYISLKPLTEQTEQRLTSGPVTHSGQNRRIVPRGIDVVNRLFDEYEKCNPGKADLDYESKYDQEEVEWAYRDNSISTCDDEGRIYFDIVGNQHLNTGLDKRQRDFNDTYNEDNPWPPNRELTVIMSEDSQTITFDYYTFD